VSTFFGGETLLDVVTVNGTAPGFSPGTIYTVPANRYAKVFVQLMRGSASSVTLSIGSMSQTTTSGGTENSWGRTVHSPNSFPMPFEVTIYAGQSININNSGTEWYLVVREFSVP
jgi:hypothetical protein